MSLRDDLIRASDADVAGRLADWGSVELLAVAYEAGRRRLASAVPNLLLILDSPDADLQQGALEALGDIGDDRAGPKVLSLLARDPVDVAIRNTAAWVLGLLRYAPAVERLAWLLRDPAPTVRSCSAAALVAIGSSSVLPAIRIALAQEADEAVRRDLCAANEHLMPRTDQLYLARNDQLVEARKPPKGVSNDPANFPFNSQRVGTS